MKIPNFQPPNKIDHPGLPDSAYEAMEVFTQQIEKITTALQKNISPEDNENSETRTMTFQSGVNYDIRLRDIKGRPREVRVLDHSVFDKVDLAWEVKDQDLIRVSLTWPATASAIATLLIRGSSDGD